MDENEFVKATDGALKILYQKDERLLGPSPNARTIAHRLGVYLEPSFDGFDVDCDYNPFGDDLDSQGLPGTVECEGQKGADWLIPDILVRNGESDEVENLAVFEVGAGRLLDECDKLKLQGLTSKKGPYGFDFGVGIEIFEDHCNRVLYVDGEQRGNPLRLDAKEVRQEKSTVKEREEGFAARSKTMAEDRANAIALEAEVAKKVAALSPEAAVERYDYLKGKSITELTESEYAERLVLGEKMTAILKQLRRKKS